MNEKQGSRDILNYITDINIEKIEILQHRTANTKFKPNNNEGNEQKLSYKKIE
jgi:hypothetical protein